MLETSISVSCVDGQSANIEDVCEAMFIEAARMLGIAFDEPISLEAQQKIMQAASSLSEKLAVLLEITGEAECELELGN